MFGRTRPPHEPSAAERAAATVTYPDAVAKAVSVLDAVLARASYQDWDKRDWDILNAALDQRLLLRPILPVIPGGEG